MLMNRMVISRFGVLVVNSVYAARSGMRSRSRRSRRTSPPQSSVPQDDREEDRKKAIFDAHVGSDSTA
jgi:hypothetical protein